MAKRPQRNLKTTKASYAIEDDSIVNQYNTRQFKKPAPLEAQTEAQAQYLCAIQSAQLIFGVGPAGTGKTYCAGAWAAEQFLAKRVDKIIITRPAIEVGQGMGFLPGELEDKYAPYLAPFREVMIERMGRGPFEYALAAKKILPEPLAFMRGKTFDNAIVILDEAQNVTPQEMKMFLTRIGKNCTVIVDGDIDQCDLNGPSGLQDALERLCNIDMVKIVEFTEDDIVRSGLVRAVLKAYRRH